MAALETSRRMPYFRDVSSDVVFRDVLSMPSLETSRLVNAVFRDVSSDAVF